MSNDPFTLVQPGDLITAQKFNAILTALADMRTRLQNLEQGSNNTATQITGFTPATVEVGATVTIQGANFVMPAVDPFTGQLSNRILIDGRPVPFDHHIFNASTTSQSLLFRIPTSVEPPELDSTGRDFLITVENSNGSAARSLRITGSTSTRPDPTIITPRGIVGAVSNSSTISIGEIARVTGTNFVQGETSVQLVFGTSNPVLFPGASGTPIAVTFTDAEHIEFTMPDPGTGNVPAGPSTQAGVRVTVQGAANTAQRSIRILRPAN